MVAIVKDAVKRSHATLIQDILGAGCLIVMLMGALHLPAFF